MPSIGRYISLLVRRSDSAKDRRRVLKTFAEWRALQVDLPPPSPRPGTLLLIRLDDIGDYLLFRNQLAMYRQSPRWSGQTITLVGNDSWRDLFEALDRDSVTDTIWVGKNHYLQSAQYRQEIWRTLRARGFETVIALSRTRPLLLDDLCVLAAAPAARLGGANTNVHDAWNALSDSFYTALFRPSHQLLHEFNFNGEFAAWACGKRFAGAVPVIDRTYPRPIAEPYVICFVGASTRSRRWPAKRWIQFITLFRREFSGRILLAGNGKTELAMVEAIRRCTDAQSIAGTLTLSELLPWVAAADIVVTNDTMAAHMSAAFGGPTLVIANGINYMRFSEYRNVGVDYVDTLYPKRFTRRRQRLGDGPYSYSETVTADIASIRASTVLKHVLALRQRRAAVR